MIAHEYLSTGCLHGDHAYCQSKTGAAGPKTPGQCKFCATPCVCACHVQPKRETDAQKIKRLERALRRAKSRSAAANTRADLMTIEAEGLRRRFRMITTSVNAMKRTTDLWAPGDKA